MTEDERVRLFVALELPERVVSALVEWRMGVMGSRAGAGAGSRLAASGSAGERDRSSVIGEFQSPSLRPITRDALHVTLCFLGWQSLAEVDRIASACRVIGGSGPPKLAVGDATWLPPRRPRVLAVGLKDPSGRLADVQAAVSRELEAGGWYVPEKRPFLAHVTLARVRGRTTAAVAARALPEPPRLAFEGSQVALFRSHLSTAGARYERLESVSL